MRVRYTPRARGDLRSILQYIDERSPRGARSVKRAIQTTVGLIGEFRKAVVWRESKVRACFLPAATRI
jgi:plasmid stabilization system protein ParE